MKQSGNECVRVHWYTMMKQSGNECVRVHWYTMMKQSGNWCKDPAVTLSATVPMDTSAHSNSRSPLRLGFGRMRASHAWDQSPPEHDAQTVRLMIELKRERA